MESNRNVVVFRKLSTAESKERFRALISKRQSIEAVNENSEMCYSATADADGRNLTSSTVFTLKRNVFRLTRSLSAIECGNVEFKVRKTERRSQSLCTPRHEIAPAADSGNDDEVPQPKLQSKSKKISFIGLFMCLPIILIFTSMVAYSSVFIFDDIKLESKSRYQTDGLLDVLCEKVYGQDLAIRTIVDELNNVEVAQESYMLILHFTGSTGTGKTYVSQTIANYLSALGSNVYWHTASHLSPSWLSSRVLLQNINVFIIDDYNQDLESLIQCIVHFKKSMESSLPDILSSTNILFIISNNQRADDIVDIAIKTNTRHILREQLTINDFTFVSSKDDLNSALEDKVKYVFVPFLPLTRDHVAKCVKKLVDSLDVQSINYDEYILLVLNSLKYFPRENPIFSELGCKKLPFI